MQECVSQTEHGRKDALERRIHQDLLIRTFDAAPRFPVHAGSSSTFVETRNWALIISGHYPSWPARDVRLYTRWNPFRWKKKFLHEGEKIIDENWKSKRPIRANGMNEEKSAKGIEFRCILWSSLIRHVQFKAWKEYTRHGQQRTPSFKATVEQVLTSVVLFICSLLSFFPLVLSGENFSP